MPHVAAGGLVAVVLASMAMPALAQSQGERIDALEQRMGAVEQQLDNQGLLEMSRQLDALSAEIRKLRGELEKLQHELERARGQQRDQYVDLDTTPARGRNRADRRAGRPRLPRGPDAEYQAAFNLLKEGQLRRGGGGVPRVSADSTGIMNSRRTHSTGWARCTT